MQTQIKSILATFTTLFLISCNEVPPQQQDNSTVETAPLTAENTPTPTPTPATTPVSTPTPTPSPAATPTKSLPSLAGILGIQESMSLKRFNAPVVSQFGGTCTAFATASAINTKLAQKGIQKRVSERHLWSLYGAYDVDYAVNAAKRNGITEQEAWPTYGTRNPNYHDHASIKIAQDKHHYYNMESALQGLNRGNPLIMAIQTPSDLGNCKAKVSANSYATRGQHVVEAIGYQLDDSVSGGGYFMIKNSWGPDCGNQGYHEYPFSLCKRNDLYCYFIEVVDVES